MATKSMVEEGIRWSIGNGESVQIWNDKWIPIPDTYKTMTPIKPLMYNEKVLTLIDKERVVWKTKLVKSIFLPHDATTILAIPLSSASPKDQKIWFAIANGVFSVCFAYWVSHKQLTKVDVGECSSNTKMVSLWKSIWQLHCLKKKKKLHLAGLQRYSPH